MKQFKKLTLLSVAVSSAMVLSACSNGNGVGKNTNRPAVENTLETVVKDDVKVVSNQINQEVKSVKTDDNKKMVITTGNNSQLSQQKVGDIVFLPPKTNKDSGIFIKIDEIKKQSNGELEFVTSIPKAEEVFEKINSNIENSPLQIVEVIAPYSKNKGLQAGLEQSGSEFGIPQQISIAISYPKAKKSDPNYALYEKFCAYPILEGRRHFRIDPEKEADKLQNKIDELCNTAIKIEGKVGLIFGNYVNSLVANQTINGLKLTKGKNGEIGLKGTKIYADLTINLAEGSKKVSETDLLKRIYAQEFFKDYEEIGVKTWAGHASITGLSADDKSGKIPLFGVVLGVASAGSPVPVFGATGSTKMKIESVSSAGVVAMIYAVADAEGKYKLEIKYGYESELMNFGYQVKNGELSLLDTDVEEESKHEFSVEGQANVEINAGATLEADFLLGGVRFANIGGGYLANPTAEINAKTTYDFSEKQWSYEGCASMGWGHGFLFFGQLGLGVDAGLNLGNFKPSIKKGVNYEFMKPTQTERKDPTYKSPLWEYKDWGRVCMTSIPADFTPTIKVVPASLSTVVGAVAATQGAKLDIAVDVPLKDASDNFRTTVKKWTLEITKPNSKIDVRDDKLEWQKPIDISFDKDGKLNRLLPILVPYGNSIVRLTAIDYRGRKITKQVKVTAESPIKTTILTMTPVPNDLVVGQDFELTITGVALGSNTMFKVDGCHNQRKVSMNTVLHIYKCTAPTMATKNHKLVVFGADGKQQYYTTKLEIHQSIPISANALEFLSEPRYYLESDNSRYSKFLFTKGAYNNGMTSYVLNDVEYQKNGNKWIIDGENRDNLKVKGNDIFLEENNTFIGKAIVSKINDLSTQGFPKGSKSYNILLTNLQDEYDIFDNENYIYQNIGSIDNLLNNYQTINHSSGNTLWLDNLVNGYEAVFTFDKSSNQTNGTVQIYQANYKNGNFQQTKLGTGTWQRVKINGNDMIKVQPLKALYSKFDDLNQDGVARIYVKRSNERGVREGEFRAKGVQDNDLFYNKIAINHLMNKNKLPVVVD